jgi:hypothetical protein
VPASVGTGAVAVAMIVCFNVFFGKGFDKSELSELFLEMIELQKCSIEGIY